jgi:hypothetical protein
LFRCDASPCRGSREWTSEIRQYAQSLPLRWLACAGGGRGGLLSRLGSRWPSHESA